MNVIWWFDSIWLWCNQHWIICRRKRRGKENLEKKKRQWNGSDVASLVFLILHKRTHVWSMKNRCVYEQEGSDSGRVEGQEKRVEEKRGEKKEKGKSGFGKSPFCFCLTVSLPLPFFLLHSTTTPQHTLILTTPYNTTHWCTASHANRTMCWCCWEHLAPSNRTVMTSFSFLQLEDFYYPIAFSMTSPNFFAICSLRKKLYFAIRGFSD